MKKDKGFLFYLLTGIFFYLGLFSIGLTQKSAILFTISLFCFMLYLTIFNYKNHNEDEIK